MVSEKTQKNIKVKAEGLTKEYQLFKTQSEKLKATLLGRSDQAPFWALRGISFEVNDGDIIGIIGTNGSGKSTLLNIISGIIPQTSGHFEVNGDISVVAINAGLKQDLTGRENIRLKQLMMGKTNKQIDQFEEDIIEFSELGDFIDQPVKSYSSGMKSKLGFSIAVYDNPEIMVVDEALSVGDNNFSQKALQRFEELVDEGKTIFFVSHSLSQVRRFTNKVMWIQDGELREFGETNEVADHYEAFNDWYKQMDAKERQAFNEERRQKQESFTMDDLKQQLADSGKTPAEVHRITERRHFSGLTPMELWPSLLIFGAALIYLIAGLV